VVQPAGLGQCLDGFKDKDTVNTDILKVVGAASPAVDVVVDLHASGGGCGAGW
jgi:hypothetical protein